MGTKIVFAVLLTIGITAVVLFNNQSADLTTADPSASDSSGVRAESAAHERRAVHALGRLEPVGTVLKIAAPSGMKRNRLDILLVEEGMS